MKLLVDIGNTRTKLGWLDTQTGQREPEPLALDPNQPTQQLGGFLRSLPRALDAVWAVNVAGPNAAQQLELTLEEHYRHTLPTHWVQAQAQALGLHNAYQNPAQLGADRWTAMLGLTWHIRQQNSHPPAALLATFGTATTIDTLQQKAPAHQGSAPTAYAFKGGLILPGTELMRTSLATGTAGLPLAQSQPTLHPTHTHAAIASGISAAQAGALLHQYLGIRQETGQAPAVYVSGGAWHTLQHSINRLFASFGTQPTWLASPILDGLAWLAQQDP